MAGMLERQVSIHQERADVLHLLHLVMQRLEKIERLLERNEDRRVERFEIAQEGSTMILGIVPGQTGTFNFTPLNKAGVAVSLNGQVPTASTSDTTSAPIVVAPDGLSATIAVPSTFAPSPGQSFTLTVAMPDGSASTSVAVPYDAIPVDNTVASFGINQTS